METTRVALAPVPVRYSYRQPSLSRKGGVRLHPLKDGVARMGEELTWLRTRDKSGQKLRDIVDPRTGYCVSVTSPLEGPVSGKGTSGSHNAQTKRAAVEVTEARGHKLYVDEDGFVCRTLDHEDGPLPVSFVRPVTPPKKERRVRNSTGDSAPKEKPRKRLIPGGTGPGGSITDSDCEALIRVMAKGREVKVTKAMLANAKMILKERQKMARKALGDK